MITLVVVVNNLEPLEIPPYKWVTILVKAMVGNPHNVDTESMYHVSVKRSHGKCRGRPASMFSVKE